ncbi:MAG: TonB-dependent receptor [Gammaproteobacteria bacterium]|nr:TonB-dependent receptor [Gammaproteobacteria bacterium]
MGQRLTLGISGFTMMLLANAPVATAATGDVASPALDEIIVTATRRETAVRDVARSVSVIGKDEIQGARQMLGLDEALARVPGLYMQNRYNFAQDLKVSLRGFGARSNFGIRGVRIFVDDIPESLPDGQAQVDSIDLGSASRIEVLRGPASSLYGNAAGGVIAVYSELGSDPPYVEATMAGGDYGYRHQQLKAAGENGAVRYMVGASGTDLDGYREHSRANGTSINARLAYRTADHDELLLTFNNTDQPRAADPGGIDAPQMALDRRSARSQNMQFDAGETLDQQRLGAVYKTNRSGGELMLRNYYVWRDFESQLPFAGGGTVSLQRFFYGAGAQYAFPELGVQQLQLTTGVDLDRQDDDRQRFDNNDGVTGNKVFAQNERVDSSGAYLLARLPLSRDATLSAGLRYDRVLFDVDDSLLSDGDDSGELEFEHWSPSLALQYALGRGMVFASFSSSFETPTTTELANPDGSGGFNELLQPQLADNFEVGIKSSHNSVFYELSIFHIDLEQELVPFEIATSPGRSYYSNAGSSSRDGVEAALSWQGRNGLSAELAYTWSDFTFDTFIDDGQDYSGKRLPGLPEHFGYIGLTYAADSGLTASIETLYSGELYANNGNTTSIGSYAVSNIRVEYRWQRGAWLFRPYLGINNVFDEPYANNIRINAIGGRYFEPAPGLNIYAGLAVTFSRAARQR